MEDVLIVLLVIVSGISLIRYLRKAATPGPRDPALYYERELNRLERRKKWAFAIIGLIIGLGFLAVFFLDWL
jgi:hypothetical protein